MSYQSLILTQAAGFWRLGELTGTTAQELSNNNDGTYSGTYTLGASTLQADGDAGLTLAGAGYVTMGDVALYEFTTAFAVEAWVLTSAVSQQMIVGKASAAAAGWLVYMTGAGQIAFAALTNALGTVFAFNSSGTVNDGRWHQVVCVWDGTTGANKASIYLDGVLNTQGTVSAGTIGSGADPFVIGAYNAAFDQKWTGSIDDVSVYLGALTAADVARHYAERLKLTSADYTVLINSVDRSSLTRWDSVEISDILNEAPNTASLEVQRIGPTIGQTLEIRVLSTTVFKGTITGVTQLQTRNGLRVRSRVEAADGMYLIDRQLVNYDYTSWNANSIAVHLVNSFTSGFTIANVQNSLAAVDLPNKMERVSQALTRLANLAGGFWYLDYTNDLHFRTTEALGHPQPLDATKWFPYRDLHYTRTVPPTTRVYVEGGGGTSVDNVVPGSTTLRVDSYIWYEATGGSVIVGSQVITYTSVLYLPEAWTTQSPHTVASFTTVAWIEELGVFLLTTNGSTIQRSVDGVTWTESASIGSIGTIEAKIVYAPSLALLVLVAGAGAGTSRVATSPDGITWTTRTAAEANTWKSVAWAPALTLFAAVASDGANRVMTSPDGITWTARAASEANIWTCVCWADALGLFVAVSSNGANRVMTSPDGITWTARAAASAATWTSVTWSPDVALLVAVSQDGAIMTSSNGTAWTSRTSPEANVWKDVIWAAIPGYFLAVSITGTSRVITSADGITWTSWTTPTGGWSRAAWSPALGRFLLAGISNPVIVMSAGAALSGIPASGAGSITVDIPAGADVNLLATRNDTGAQTVLAALEGGDGIHERYIQDRRLSLSGANARGDAELTLGSDPEDALTVVSEDPFMISGRTLTVNIGSITSLTARIQQVRTTWPRDRKLPQREVVATNVFKTLYQYLRDLDDRADNRRS